MSPIKTSVATGPSIQLATICRMTPNSIPRKKPIVNRIFSGEADEDRCGISSSMVFSTNLPRHTSPGSPCSVWSDMGAIPRLTRSSTTHFQVEIRPPRCIDP